VSESRSSTHAGAPVLAPVAVGVLAGVVVQVLAYVALVAAVLAGGADGVRGAGFTVRTAGLGAVGLALACGVAARVCGWRLRGRDLPRSWMGVIPVGTGLGVGVMLLVLGLVPVLRWSTVPLYLVGVLGGGLVGGRVGRPARR